MGRKSKVSSEIKVKVVQEHLAGLKTMSQITYESEKYSLELKLLKAENKKLKMENDFLKKLEEIERRSINQV